MDSKTFAEEIAVRLGSSVKEAADMVAAFASVLHTRAVDLDSIAIPGFGNFVSLKQGDQIMVDKTTGKRMLMPPVKKIEFVASNVLRKYISDKHE